MMSFPDGAEADYNTEHIVAMPDTETDFSDGSYHNALRLSDITLSGRVTIGRDCFVNCPVLSVIDLTNGDMVIGGGSFNSCAAESLLTRECSLEIGENCFRDLFRLEYVDIDEGLTAIGAGSFVGCPSLTSVSLPASLTEIGEGCFENCSEYLTITAPEGSYAEEYAKAHGIAYTAPWRY